jgi:parallel beta-helix repeat protein
MMSLLVLGTLALAFNVQPVRASGTVHIRADGSIDPPTAPIYTADNITYTLTGNITADANGIAIERDNIVVDGAGYAVTGSRIGNGTTLTSISNVTVRNITTKNFINGIFLDSSSDNVLSGNNVTANYDDGIRLEYSSNNTLSGNNVTNNDDGIRLDTSSDNNVLSGNNVSANNYYGIFLDSSSNNTLSDNIVTDNNYGIYLHSFSDNFIFHNSFVGNAIQVWVAAIGSNNTWDDGFPSGGNYWSNYDGTDVSRGPYQNETGSDGIGDTPYVIDGNNRDKFPLMKPYPWAAHDVGVTSVATSKNVVGQGYNASINVMMFNYGDDTENVNATIYANQTAIGETHNAELTSGNFTVIRFTWNTTGFSKGNYTISARAEPVQGETDTSDNTLADGLITVTIPGDLDANLQVQRADLVILANAYGSRPGDLKWNPNADVNDNSVVDLLDLVLLANHYGQQYP